MHQLSLSLTQQHNNAQLVTGSRRQRLSPSPFLQADKLPPGMATLQAAISPFNRLIVSTINLILPLFSYKLKTF